VGADAKQNTELEEGELMGGGEKHMGGKIESYNRRDLRLSKKKIEWTYREEWKEEGGVRVT